MNGKLHISYNAEKEIIEIVGDENGLKYLSQVCNQIIGKKGPAAHFHLMSKMNNIEKGSIDTDIYFDEGITR
jgi:hypothetical protein